MNRNPAGFTFWVVILCVCAALGAGCRGEAAKEERANFDSDGLPRERVGAEDFMPEPVRAVFTRSCGSCHGPDGRGITAVAPSLHRAKHRSADEWDKYLRNSRSAHPVGHEPPLWLTADEIKAMADYLDSLTRRNQ